MKKRTVILAIILALGLVATSCPGEPTTDGGATGPPQVGKPAPDFELDTLDGQTVVLSQLRGRLVLVNFWATWCGPCRHEMPFLQYIHEKGGVMLLTVNVGESSSEVSQFMQSQGFSFTVLLDGEAAVAQKYNVMGIPTTLFIDKEGVIQNIKVGAFQNQAEIETILSKID
jgi:thiol-disulfide isomerase/thioredoxin